MPEARWTEYDKTRALLADEWPLETQPSLYLQARLRAMDWDVDDFFSTFSRDPYEVYGILDGTWKCTTTDGLLLAAQLSALTGTSRTLWEVLMTRYRQYSAYMKLIIEGDHENVNPS